MYCFKKHTHSIVIGPDNVLFAGGVRASFSPEILHDGAVKGLIWFCGLYSFKGETESSPKSGIPSITKSILRLALLTTVSPELRFGVLFIRVPLCLEMYTLFGSESRAALTWLWKQCELTSNVVELQFLNFLTRTAILLLFFLLILKGNYRFNRFLFFLCIVRLAVKN